MLCIYTNAPSSRKVRWGLEFVWYNKTKLKTLVYIDTRNFLGKLEEVFKSEKVPVSLWHEYDFKGLVNKVLEGIVVDVMVFYLARIKEHPDTKSKSQALIQARRLLKTHYFNPQFRSISICKTERIVIAQTLTLQFLA